MVTLKYSSYSLSHPQIQKHTIPSLPHSTVWLTVNSQSCDRLFPLKSFSARQLGNAPLFPASFLPPDGISVLHLLPGYGVAVTAAPGISVDSEVSLKDLGVEK